MTSQIHTLSNGMRIVTEQVAGAQSTALGVWVSAGARHETEAQNGIAHFLEHMAFKGTKTRSALQIAEAIEDVGGFINAYTSREATAYYVRVLPADTALGLDVIADILRNPIFDPREIEIERGVILQEIGQSLDTPDDVLFDWLQEAAFPQQAMGRTILGPTDRVRGFSRDDLAGFTGQHYGPEQMILSVAGAVNPDQILRMAEQLFGDMTPQSQKTADPARFAAGEARQLKALEQAHLALAFEGPGYKAPDYYAAQVFSVAFGGGMSSRLFQEIREKRGLCYTISSHIDAYSDAGLMTVYSGTSGEDIASLTDITVDELKRAAEDMSQVEIARAKAQMKAGLLMGLESSAARAERNARVLAIWDDIPPIADTVAKIDAIDVTSARNFAAKLVGSGRAAMALYGPVEHARDLDAVTRRLAA